MFNVKDEKIVLAIKALENPTFDAGIIQSILKLLRTKLLFTDPEKAKLAVSLGAINKMNSLLDHSSTEIVKEAVWILTNLAASESKYVGIIRTLGIEYKALDLIVKGNDQIKEIVKNHNEVL